MEHRGDIVEDRTGAASWPTSGSILLAMHEVLSAIKRLVKDKTALRRGDLVTLRQMVSLFVFMMMLVTRPIIGWRERAVTNALASTIRARRSLRKPPESWSAP